MIVIFLAAQKNIFNYKPNNYWIFWQTSDKAFLLMYWFQMFVIFMDLSIITVLFVWYIVMKNVIVQKFNEGQNVIFFLMCRDCGRPVKM